MQIQQRERLLLIFPYSHPQLADEVVNAGWCTEDLHLRCQKHFPHNGFFRAVTLKRNRPSYTFPALLLLFVVVVVVFVLFFCLLFAVCCLLFAVCSLFSVLCFLFSVLCSLLSTLSSLFFVLCCRVVRCS